MCSEQQYLIVITYPIQPTHNNITFTCTKTTIHVHVTLLKNIKVKQHPQLKLFAINLFNVNIKTIYMFHTFAQNDGSFNELNINVQNITLHTKQ